MFADMMHIVRLDSYCHCAPLELYQWFPEKTFMCFSFADRAEPDSNDFFLVLYYRLSSVLSHLHVW